MCVCVCVCMRACVHESICVGRCIGMGGCVLGGGGRQTDILLLWLISLPCRRMDDEQSLEIENSVLDRCIHHGGVVHIFVDRKSTYVSVPVSCVNYKGREEEGEGWGVGRLRCLFWFTCGCMAINCGPNITHLCYRNKTPLLKGLEGISAKFCTIESFPTIR